MTRFGECAAKHALPRYRSQVEQAKKMSAVITRSFGRHFSLWRPPFLGAAVNCGWFRIETTIKGQLDGETETPISLVPTASDYSHMEFAFPTEFAELEAGTKILFTFKLHGGVEGSQEQLRTFTCDYATA